MKKLLHRVFKTITLKFGVVNKVLQTSWSSFSTPYCIRNDFNQYAKVAISADRLYEGHGLCLQQEDVVGHCLLRLKLMLSKICVGAVSTKLQKAVSLFCGIL